MKKWKFQGWLTKNHVEFVGSWFLALEIPMGVTQFCRISRVEASFCLEFVWVRVKWQILKFHVSFSKKYILNSLSCLGFFWNRPISWTSATLVILYSNKLNKVNSDALNHHDCKGPSINKLSSHLTDSIR